MLFDSIGGFARILLQTAESPSGCPRCARLLLTVLKSSMFARSLLQTLTTLGLCALLMLCACVAAAHEGPHRGQVTAPVSSPEAPMSRDADSLVTTLLPGARAAAAVDVAAMTRSSQRPRTIHLSRRQERPRCWLRRPVDTSFVCTRMLPFIRAAY